MGFKKRGLLQFPTLKLQAKCLSLFFFFKVNQNHASTSTLSTFSRMHRPRGKNTHYETTVTDSAGKELN